MTPFGRLFYPIAWRLRKWFIYPIVSSLLRRRICPMWLFKWALGFWAGYAFTVLNGNGQDKEKVQ